jgi:hypothetical protein
VWVSAAVILIFGLFPDAIVALTQRSTPIIGREPAAGSPALGPLASPRSGQPIATISTDSSIAGH